MQAVGLLLQAALMNILHVCSMILDHQQKRATRCQFCNLATSLFFVSLGSNDTEHDRLGVRLRVQALALPLRDARRGPATREVRTSSLSRRC